jgi:para-nitrobenzyl esterase
MPPPAAARQSSRTRLAPWLRPPRWLAAVAMIPLLALAAGTGPTAQAVARQPTAALVVRTDDGAVRGVGSGGAREFLGVPYAAPPVGGLFVHAIAESGCLMPMPSRQAIEQRDAALAASLGCRDAATAAGCLRAKPTAELVAAEGSSPLPSVGWGPVPGGPILPALPATAFATGRYLHVPLLQGSTADEGRLLVGLAFDALGKPLTAAQFQADDLLSASRVYGYEFGDPDPPSPFGITFSFPLGSAHSTELEYLFQKLPDIGVIPRPNDITPPFTAAQFALSDQIMGYWARFAATGDPNGAGAPFWPAFTPAQHQIQELTSTGTTPQAGFAAEHQCAFWDSTGV